jgi:hypothetical protein
VWASPSHVGGVFGMTTSLPLGPRSPCEGLRLKAEGGGGSYAKPTGAAEEGARRELCEGGAVGGLKEGLSHHEGAAALRNEACGEGGGE